MTQPTYDHAALEQLRDDLFKKPKPPDLATPAPPPANVVPGEGGNSPATAHRQRAAAARLHPPHVPPRLRRHPAAPTRRGEPMSTASRLITATCKQLGVPLPKPLAKAELEADAFVQSMPNASPSHHWTPPSTRWQPVATRTTNPPWCAGRSARSCMTAACSPPPTSAPRRWWRRHCTPAQTNCWRPGRGRWHHAGKALAKAVEAGVTDLRDPTRLKGEHTREAWAHAASAPEAYAQAETGWAP